MSTVVTFRGLGELQFRLQALAERNDRAASLAALGCAEKVHTVMQTEFLRGQAIGMVDRALIQGWNVRPTTAPIGAVLFTSIPYARAQEYGFKGVVSIKAHKRRKGVSRRRGESDRRYKERRNKLDEPIATRPWEDVDSHSRRMNLKPRKFLRGAIERTRSELPKLALAIWRREVAG